MSSAVNWKLGGIIRLILGMICCAFAGMLIIGYLTASHGGQLPRYTAAAAVSLLCLVIALVMSRGSLLKGGTMTHLTIMLILLYAGMAIGAFAQKFAGTAPKNGTISQMIIGVLCVQGAALVLITLFLREHVTGWREGFGLVNEPTRAVIFGIVTAVVFIPVGAGMLAGCAWLMQHLTMLPPPEEQKAIQILRSATGWPARTVLGLLTILVAPIAEEALFRGIIYRGIRQTGQRQLALWGSAILFAASHMDLTSFLPLLALALVLTWLYERTDNLLACFITHGLFNAVNFSAVYYFSDKAG